MGWLSPMRPKSLRSKRFRGRRERCEVKADNFVDGRITIDVPNKSTKQTTENQISKTMTNASSCVTKTSSKPSVKGWMRRVLRKGNPSSAPNSKSSMFRTRSRIKKTSANIRNEKLSPTNNGRVVDESSSHHCESRTAKSPLQKSLTVSITEAYDSPNVSPNDTYQNNQCNVGNTTPKTLPLSPTSSDTTGGVESPHPCKFQTFYFKKSEIISKLFPKGYPSSQASDNCFDQEGIDFVGRHDDEEVTSDGSAERSAEETPKRSPFSRSEVARFLFPMGHPEEAKCNPESAEMDSASVEPNVNESDEFIGLVISFDPTWDLLRDGPDETDTMVRSRLRKLFETENYSNSILGKFSEEESSENSEGLLAEANLSFGTQSSTFPLKSTFQDFIAKGTSPNTSFELGYHFDHKRFPVVHPSEVEICFYSDKEPIEFNEDVVIPESCKTLAREIENPMIRQQLEFLCRMDESRDNVHVDDSDSMSSIEGEIIFVDESLGCCSSDSSDGHSRSSIDPILHPSPFRSSPQQTLFDDKLFLFTDKDDNYTTECESSSTTSTEISPIQYKLREERPENLFIPQLRSSARLATSKASITSSPMRQGRQARALRL